MSRRSAQLEFRPPARPEGDVRLFEDALATLQDDGRGARGRSHYLSGSGRTPAVLLVVLALVVLASLATALAFRVIALATPAPPEPSRAPSDFAVRVEDGVADVSGKNDGRFMLATIAVDEGTTHAADAAMQKVLRDGTQLMNDAKRDAREAAAACLGRPVRASIDAGDVIGASGGLMFALAIVDELTPGDLTGGRLVAGTGAISADGRVGPVLSMRGKVESAERAGAELFLVPSEQLAEAAGFARTIRVAGVANLAEALAALGAGAGCAA